MLGRNYFGARILTLHIRVFRITNDYSNLTLLLVCTFLHIDVDYLQGSLPIYSSRIAVSVVDNVLLVHQVDAKVVILYDIFADSRAPISAPLPLLLRGFRRLSASTSRSSREESDSSEANVVSDSETVVYGDDWIFLVPDLVCDVANKFLWKIHLDLEASSIFFFFHHLLIFRYCSCNQCLIYFRTTVVLHIKKKNQCLYTFFLQAISASSSEMSSVLEFLQRRKLEANKVVLFM
jgi:hypothetical protein